MFKRQFFKPDGRAVVLYSSKEDIDPNILVPSPNATPVEANPHLRWHPLRGEWVAYAAHRQNRTFLPPKEYNPLAPMVVPTVPTELPVGNYDIAVFENLFPSFVEKADSTPDLIVTSLPAKGACEVVVFTQDANASLGSLPLQQIKLLIDV